MSDCILDPGSTDLARRPKSGLATAGRYESSKSTKFRDLCAEASQGDKYDLNDEIQVIKGLLATLIKGLENPDETKDLYQRLIKAEFPAASAEHICRCVSQHGSPKNMATVLKELRETLKQAAEFEGMVPILRVREWVRSFMRIVREEVKDDIVIERIRIRAGSEPV